MINRFLHVMLCLSCAIGVNAQAPGVDWALIHYGGLDDYAADIATDLDGNVIQVGRTRSTPGLDFNLQGNIIVQSPEAPGQSYANSNYRYSDSYIAKFDQSGGLVWHERTTGGYAEIMESVATDVQGNMLVGMSVLSTDGALGSYSLAESNTFWKGYVVKLDAAGNVLWSQKILATQGVYPTTSSLGAMVHQVETDAAGNVYVAGEFFAETITMGSLSLTASMASPVQGDRFIARFSPTGDPEWLIGIQGTATESISRFNLDSQGDLYVSGVTGSPDLIIGNSVIPTGINVFGSESFTARIGAGGQPVWVDLNSYTTLGYSTILSISETIPDDNGGAIIVGSTYAGLDFFSTWTVTFGTTSIAIPYSTSPDSLRGSLMFVARYSDAGAPQWMVTSEDIHNRAIGVSGIDLDGNGCLYIAGRYIEPTTIAGDLLPNVDYCGSGCFEQYAYKGYIAKLDRQGNFLWSRQAGTTFRMIPEDLEVDVLGNVYLTGSHIQGDILFDSLLVAGYPISGGYLDAFLVRFGATGGNCEGTVGIAEGVDEVVHLYPNPFRDVVHINPPGNLRSIEVFDALGKRVALFHEPTHLDVSMLGHGLYLFRMTDRQGRAFVQRMVRDR